MDATLICHREGKDEGNAVVLTYVRFFFVIFTLILYKMFESQSNHIILSNLKRFAKKTKGQI